MYIFTLLDENIISLQEIKNLFESFSTSVKYIGPLPFYEEEEF